MDMHCLGYVSQIGRLPKASFTRTLKFLIGRRDFDKVHLLLFGEGSSYCVQDTLVGLAPGEALFKNRFDRYR